MSIQFDKTYAHPFEIITLLKGRGLNIGDSGRAEHYIRNIGYYRLSAYLYPLLQMPKELHRYKEGSTFQDALNLYRFDKKLRLFLFNEIEKVEIALRSALANIVAEYFVDDSHHTYKKHLLPSCKGVEQRESYHSHDCQETVTALDKSVGFTQ